MNTLLKSLIFVITIVFANGQVKEGSKTKEACAEIKTDTCDGAEYCILVKNSKVYDYVYVNGTCKLCQDYGSSDATAIFAHNELSLKLWQCPNLKVASVAANVPECKAFAIANTPFLCHNNEPYTKICAVINNEEVEANGVCEFCDNYGNTNAKIKTISYDENETWTCNVKRVFEEP